MQPLDLLPPFEETRPGKPLPPTPLSPPYLHDWHLPTAPLTIAQFAFDSHFFSNPDSLFSQLDEQLSRNSQIEVEPVREEEITPEMFPSPPTQEEIDAYKCRPLPDPPTPSSMSSPLRHPQLQQIHFDTSFSRTQSSLALPECFAQSHTMLSCPSQIEVGALRTEIPATRPASMESQEREREGGRWGESPKSPLKKMKDFVGRLRVGRRKESLDIGEGGGGEGKR